MGVPDDEAAYYDQEFQSGRTIVKVKFDGRYELAQEILRQHSSYDVGTRPTDTAAGPAAPADSNETGVHVEGTAATTSHMQPMAKSMDAAKAESPMGVNAVSESEPVVSEEPRLGRAAEHEVKQEAGQSF